jgi:hypothetical protein
VLPLYRYVWKLVVFLLHHHNDRLCGTGCNTHFIALQGPVLLLLRDGQAEREIVVVCGSCLTRQLEFRETF